jgi:hypothetical protein
MQKPPDLAEVTDPSVDRKMVAAIEWVRSTVSKTFQLRYQDDEQPVVWMALAGFPDDHYEVAAALNPLRAVLRLCEKIGDGGVCTHCSRPSGFEPDSLNLMPMSDVVCWYQWDPELGKYRRGCEGDTP